MTQQYDVKIGEALQVIEAKELTEDKQITLTTGVVLRLKKVNVLRINAINDQFKYPEVPKVYDENKGREIRNPDHPDYVRACQEMDAQRSMALIDAIAALGTEVVSVPDNIQKPEDNGWVEECEVLNIPVKKDSPLARYMAWIKYVAILDTADFMKIANEFGMMMGTSEGLVASTIQTNFPN